MKYLIIFLLVPYIAGAQIPGNTWQRVTHKDTLALYGAGLLSQDSASLSGTSVRQSIITLGALIGVMQDSATPQSLSISNDSLSISSGNTVVLPGSPDTLYFNNLQALNGDTISVLHNVKNYGVTGDGVTDDTDSIQVALEAHNNLYFPAGTYAVTEILIDNDNQSIEGSGANTIFKFAIGQGANVSPIKVQGPTGAGNYVNNVTLKNFAVDGSADLDTNYTAATQNEGVNALGNTRNLVIDRLTIYNVGPDGIDIDDDNLGLRIMNCEVYDCGKSGLHLYGLKNAIVLGNTVYNCADVGVDFTGGLTFNNENSLFQSNIIDSCGTGIRVTSAEGLKIYDNTVVNTIGGGPSAYAAWGIFVAELNIGEVQLKGNTIKDVLDDAITGQVDLVSQNTIDGCVDGVAISNSEGGSHRVIIESNQIKNCSGSGIVTSVDVNMICRGNFIDGKGIVSIADSALIVDNKVSNSSTNGISVTGEATKIYTNEVTGSGAQGITVSATATRSIVLGNYIDGAADNGIILSGARSVATGNYIRNITAAGRGSISLNKDSTHAIANIIEGSRQPFEVNVAADDYTILNNVIIDHTHDSDINSSNGWMLNNIGVDEQFGAERLRTMSTTDRNLVVGAAGMMIYNSTVDSLQFYNGSDWLNLNHD